MSSSILLLLDDGEMHPFVPGANTGPIVLSRPGGPYGDSGVISGVDPDQMTLGSHFLTSSAADHHHGARGGGADHLGDGSVVTKIEVDQGHHHGIGSMGRGGVRRKLNNKT